MLKEANCEFCAAGTEAGVPVQPLHHTYSHENASENWLTCITDRIHCPATLSDDAGQNASEAGRITIQHFLDTLAEVALAMASRRVRRKAEGDKTP